jgi:hypothetical protein
MVYAADPTVLLATPLLAAMASNVSLAETGIAELYTGELVVGMVPLVV